MIGLMQFAGNTGMTVRSSEDLWASYLGGIIFQATFLAGISVVVVGLTLLWVVLQLSGWRLSMRRTTTTINVAAESAPGSASAPLDVIHASMCKTERGSACPQCGIQHPHHLMTCKHQEMQDSGQ